MNTPALTRLARILDLEERQNWRNKSVIGGMQAMAPRWAEDARREGVEAPYVDALVARMQRYEATPLEQRSAVVAEMRAILAGDLPAVPEAPAAQPPVSEPQIAQPPAAPPPAKAASRPERRPESRAETRSQPSEPPFTGPPVAEPTTIDEMPLEIPLGDDLTLLNPAAETSPAAAEQETVQAVPAHLEIMPGLGKVYEAEPDEGDVQPARQPPAARQRRVGNVKRNARDLQSNVTILTGIGPAAAEQLARLGITKVEDLVWHWPARYDDFSKLRTIDKLEPGEQATVVANLWSVRERKISMNRTVVEATLGDSTGTLRAVWYNKWIAKQLKPNSTLRFSGKVDLFRGHKTLSNPAFEDIDDDAVATGRLSPVYPLTEGLSNNKLRGIIHDVVDDYAQFVQDPLPRNVRDRYQLLDLPTALRQVHFPDNDEQLAAARRRLGFEELFYIQLGVQQRRRALRQADAPAFDIPEELLTRYTDLLPFAMTGAQQRVTDEILRDVQRSVPMTRLVQGDVGSGKTAVAAAAMWAAAANGFQSAMLAPTQILAEQHHRGVARLLGQLTRPDGGALTVALLTGRVTGAARDEVLQGLADGSIDVVVGTTALIQETVEFAQLGLVVVDEQHRFGVEQRGVLRSRAAAQPHLLVMSATPIPRSLALTVYGELDISAIDEMPPGRTPITTKVFHPTDRERLYNFIRREVAAGRQAYVVYPLVEESEALDVGAATTEHQRLQQDVFPELRVALLHGQMTGTEKDAVMSAYAAGDYQVLVSTTVIEVGIDVPNATVMVVEDADRFGLAQLHQLRGRVGRGQHPGYCALITKSETPATRERLALLADKDHGTDGFWIAQKDLELRGPGEFLGTRQSGLTGLRIAQLSDFTTIDQAREAAQTLFQLDPELENYPQLARQVERFWRGQGDVS